MPRDVNGDFSLPTNDSSPAAPRNVIRSSDFNELMTDISTAITASLWNEKNLSDVADQGEAQDNMQVGAVFADKATAVAATIPTRNKRIRTQFYDTAASKRAGGANYRESSAAEVAKYPSRSWFQSNGGARYWLLDELRPNAYQFGGVGDGVADDAVALQQLLDFWSPQAQLASGTVTTRPLAMAGGGTVHIPKGVWRHTVTLNQNAFIVIEGDGVAMFPQAPMDGTTYGQYAFPNATILRPDFAAPDRALGVGIQVSPYVLKPVVGQTVGTRFRSVDANLTNASVDNGDISYCEGSNISDLTVWPVNEILAGVRWTAGSNSKLSRFGARNVMRGIICESTWESTIYEPHIYDFKDYGIYGGIGNLHSFGVFGGWIHAGGRVLAGDRPVGFHAAFFNGLVLDAVAIDECWSAISLATGAGAQITGIHSERTKNVWLTTNNAYGIVGHGNHMIQNVVDARTYDDTIIWDGNNCQVDIGVTVNLNGSGTDLHPGYTYFQGVNPNTGSNTNLAFATGNRTDVIFRGMKPTAKDGVRVNRLSGNMKFMFDGGETLIAGSGLANQYVVVDNVKGDSGAKRTTSVQVNGTQQYYSEEDATGTRFYSNTNVLLMGYRYSDNAFLWGNGLVLTQRFGTPEANLDAPKGGVGIDTNLGRIFLKKTAAGSTAGWEGVEGIQVEATAANIASAAATINTTNKHTGRVVWDTTNNRAMRSMGGNATSAWRTLDGVTTVTPV